MRPDAILETTVPTSWRNPSVRIIRRARGITVLESSYVSRVLISHIPTYILHISYLIFSYHTSQGEGGACYATNKLLQNRVSMPLGRTIFDLLTMRCFSNLSMRLIAQIRLHRSTNKYTPIHANRHKYAQPI